MLTPEQLAEISQRAEAATEGPWQIYDSCSWRRIGLVHEYQTVICPTVEHDGHPDLLARPEDLEFAAHARTDIPKLIAEIKRLREQRDDWQRRAGQWAHDNQGLRGELDETMREKGAEIMDRLGDLPDSDPLKVHGAVFGKESGDD